MTPDSKDLWFIPLGGCGEIGMNMNLYGHDDQWIMVDCGVTFRDVDGSNRSGYDVQMADPAFIRATEFTKEMLRRKLSEQGLEGKAEVHVIKAGDRMDIGAFNVEWIPNSHSTPNPCAVVLRTAAGSVFHTADWKLDAHPLVGHSYEESTYKTVGESGIQAMVCDSTCANQPGHSMSESNLYEGLKHHVENASGRVVVACFGSNIARLHSIARVAETTNRHLGLLGRSLINTVSAARTTRLWSHSSDIVESAHLAYLPRESLLLVATGSQGEPRTALNRLSHDSFKDLNLEAGDTVIFSARAIPGNEKSIENLIARLEAKGIHIVTPDSSPLPIHASGHPGAEELRLLYQWINPELLIPVHGEEQHMNAQSELAQKEGITKQLTGKNGDLFMIAPTIAIRRNAVAAGRLGIGRRTQLEKIG